MRETIASQLAAASKMQRLEIRLRGASAMGFLLFIFLSVILSMVVIYSRLLL